MPTPALSILLQELPCILHSFEYHFRSSFLPSGKPFREFSEMFPPKSLQPKKSRIQGGNEPKQNTALTEADPPLMPHVSGCPILENKLWWNDRTLSSTTIKLWVLKIKTKTTRLFLRVLLWQICHAFLSPWHIPQRRNPKASMCIWPHTDTGQPRQEQLHLLHGSGTKALSTCWDGVRAESAREPVDFMCNALLNLNAVQLLDCCRLCKKWDQK